MKNYQVKYAAKKPESLEKRNANPWKIKKGIYKKVNTFIRISAVRLWNKLPWNAFDSEENAGFEKECLMLFAEPCIDCNEHTLILWKQIRWFLLTKNCSSIVIGWSFVGKSTPNVPTRQDTLSSTPVELFWKNAAIFPV